MNFRRPFVPPPRSDEHRVRHAGLRPLKLFAWSPLLSHVYHVPKSRGERKLNTPRARPGPRYSTESSLGFAPNSAVPTTAAQRPPSAERSSGSTPRSRHAVAATRRPPRASPARHFLHFLYHSTPRSEAAPRRKDVQQEQAAVPLGPRGERPRGRLQQKQPLQLRRVLLLER